MPLRFWLRWALLLAPAFALVSGPQTLREAAQTTGILVGTAVRPSLFSEAAYSATLAREYDLVEPEDAMKWWTLRPDAATFNFRDGDEIVRFAQAHNMKVRGHCLVWDHDNPDWLAQGHFTPAATIPPAARPHHDRDEALRRPSLRLGRSERSSR